MGNDWNTELEVYVGCSWLYLTWYSEKEMSWRDFPGGTVVKNPPLNAGDTGLIPGLGRSHMPRNN